MDVYVATCLTVTRITQFIAKYSATSLDYPIAGNLVIWYSFKLKQLGKCTKSITIVIEFFTNFI